MSVVVGDQTASTQSFRSRRTRKRRYSSGAVGEVSVKLHIPVEIITPTLGSIANPNGDCDHGIPSGLVRFLDQSHASFIRSVTTFSVITTPAGGHDIFPAFLPTSGDRSDMIECEVFRLKPLVAVLTGVPIAGENVDPGKLHRTMTVFESHHFQEPHHGRKLDGKRYALDVPVVDL